MALIICPECRNQVSSDAVACPNCGRPLSPVVVEPIPSREVFVEDGSEKKGLPPWAIALMSVLGVGLLFALLFLWRSSNDDSNRNINVSMAESNLSRNSSVSTNSGSTQVTVPPTQSSNITIPPSQTTATTTATVVPSQTPISTSTPSTTTTSSSEDVSVGKSVLNIDAKIRDTTGTEKAVQKETFYLLKKDLESVLREADIKDEDGQGLVNAFGMSVVFPEKYSETRRKALAEINKNVVAKTLTDAQGKAKFPDVKPDNYYLFGITKTKDGFSVWNQPITLGEGATNLNLTPSSSR